LTSIVYYILAYKEPLQIVRLVNRLSSSDDYFYVHFGLDVGKKKFSEWKSMVEKECDNLNIIVTSEYITKRGSFESVLAPLKAMRFYGSTNYDYFINLTGECYPIMHPLLIKRGLEGYRSAFMEFFEMPAKVWGNGGMERLHKNFFFLSMGKNYRTFRLPRFRKTMPCNLKPFGGSAAFCLHKEQVSYILDFLDRSPQVLKFFRHVGFSDEIFFQTILLNSQFRSDIINDDKRFIVWSGLAGGHPNFLVETDLKKIMSSGKLFARKFSTTLSGNLLNLVDQELEKQLDPS
jgi:hypothetical protein